MDNTHTRGIISSIAQRKNTAHKRPRDRYGRPLPWGSVNELETIQFSRTMTPVHILQTGQYLLDTGQAFSAHELFELAWRHSVGNEKTLWQGLVCLSVALTHCQRNNPSGAKSALSQTIEHLQNLDNRAIFGHNNTEIREYCISLQNKITYFPVINQDWLQPPRLL